MDEQAFKKRTKQFGLDIIQLVQGFPKDDVCRVLGKQLLRAATSVGANYRAACRGRSAADVISKLSVVEEEADEALYWMEMVVESNLVPKAEMTRSMSEADEIIAMIVASSKTLRRNQQADHNPKSKIQNQKSQ